MSRAESVITTQELDGHEAQDVAEREWADQAIAEGLQEWLDRAELQGIPGVVVGH